jgi:putative ABC transport system permease protein
MFRHLLKLIWKRKSRNLMLSLEILIAFLIVFAICAAGLRNLQLYRLPIGFVSDDVWAVNIYGVGEASSRLTADTYDQMRRGLLSLPEARKVSFSSTAPYSNSSFHTGFKTADGREIETEIAHVSEDFLKVLSIPLVAGRDFDATDRGAPATSVIINRRLAHDMFGTSDVLGKQFDSAERGGPGRKMKRVVGLIDDYRKKGEFGAPDNVTVALHAAPSEENPLVILIKVAPGTPRAFEETLSRQLKLINNNWQYQIAPVPAMRTASMKSLATPMIILSIVAAFLLLMVAFGLFGVLWQNTTRRIPEIGLRRAVGAHAGSIYRQIIAEQFLLSSGAMLVALLLLVQLPITGVLGEALNWPVFAAATLLSMAVIYLLSLLCSVYPGWRASRMSPTQALHYE